MAEPEQEPQGPLMASVERLRRELDHWVDVAMSQSEKALDRLGLRGAGRTWWPAVDVYETHESVEVLIDLPGVDPASVELTLVGNMLTVEGQKPKLEIDESRILHSRERVGGKFSRPIPMPAPVDPDSVTAEADNGTLRVHLAKTDVAKPRQIPIGTSQPPPAQPQV